MGVEGGEWGASRGAVTGTLWGFGVLGGGGDGSGVNFGDGKPYIGWGRGVVTRFCFGVGWGV
jgi:hypothetical protein